MRGRCIELHFQTDRRHGANRGSRRRGVVNVKSFHKGIIDFGVALCDEWREYWWDLVIECGG